MRIMPRAVLLCSAVAGLLPSALSAQVWVGSNFGGGVGGPRGNADGARAAYTAATGATLRTNLEGLAAGPVGGPTGIGGGIVASPDAFSSDNIVVGGNSGELGYNTTFLGNTFYQHKSANFGPGQSSVTLSFAPVHSFGAYFTGLEWFYGVTTATWFDGSAMSHLLPDTGPDANGDAGIAFFGIETANAITSITFTTVDNSGRRDFWGIDDIYLNEHAVAPEPSSMIMLATGLIGVAALVRRRVR